MIHEQKRIESPDPGKSMYFDDMEPVIQSVHIVNRDTSVPRFGNFEQWDLLAAGIAPNRTVASAIMRFSRFEGSWNLLARELAMILLNPQHPALVTRGLSGHRKPATTRTVLHTIGGNLWAVHQWAKETGRLESVNSWDASDADEFIRFRRIGRGTSTVHSDAGAFRMLHTFRAVLTGGGMAAEPWHESISNSRRAGHKVSNELRTIPMSPEQWRRVVSAAWRYIDDFSEDIMDAHERLKAPFGTGSTEHGSVRKSVRRMLAENSFEIPIYPVRAGSAQPGDINFQAILIGATGRRWRQPKGTLGPKLVQQIERLKSEGRNNHGPAVKYLVDGVGESKIPWRGPIVTSGQLKHEENNLRAACYLIISAFTMMRDSEIQGIKTGKMVNHYGSPAIKSVVVKHDRTQIERYWWAAEPVRRAIEVLSFNSKGEWLFNSQRNFGSSRFDSPPGIHSASLIGRFIVNINKNAEIWGLKTIDTAVNSRRLRRTMAVIAGSAEDGSIAVALQLKHATTFAVANNLSSAYAAPNETWEREFHTSRTSHTALQLLDQWDSSLASKKAFASGPGRQNASDLVSGCYEDYKADFAGIVGDVSIQSRLLSKGLGRIRLGSVSHCLGDPQVAACLSQVEKARGDLPKPIMCRPDRCGNSFATSDHFALLKSELEQLEQRLAKTTHVQSKTATQQRIDEVNRLLEVGNDA